MSFFKKTWIEATNSAGPRGYFDPHGVQGHRGGKSERTCKCQWNPPCPASKLRSVTKLKEACGADNPNTRKNTTLGIVEAHELVRTRLEETRHKDHEISFIAEKGFQSLSQDNLCAPAYSNLKRWKSRLRKPQLAKSWRGSNSCQRGQVKKGQAKKRFQRTGTKRAKNSSFFDVEWICVTSRKTRNWSRSSTTYNGRLELLSDVVEDDSGCYAEFTEQGSSASPMTTEKVLDIFRQSTWVRRASKRRSISLHPRQNGRRSETADTSQVRLSRHLDSVTAEQLAKKRGRAFKNPVG